MRRLPQWYCLFMLQSRSIGSERTGAAVRSGRDYRKPCDRRLVSRILFSPLPEESSAHRRIRFNVGIFAVFLFLYEKNITLKSKFWISRIRNFKISALVAPSFVKCHTTTHKGTSKAVWPIIRQDVIISRECILSLEDSAIQFHFRIWRDLIARWMESRSIFKIHIWMKTVFDFKVRRQCCFDEGITL